MIVLMVLGAGTFAMEVTDIAEDVGHSVLCYVVNVPTGKKTLLGRPVYEIEKTSLHSTIMMPVRAVGAIIDLKRNKLVEEIQSLGFNFANVTHYSASMSRTAKVGKGVVVNRNAVIGSHAKIGNHVIVNRGCLVGHHVKLGDYVTMGPGVNIAGAAEIGDRVFIGMGAQIFPKVVIPDDSVVSAGSVVKRWN